MNTGKAHIPKPHFVYILQCTDGSFYVGCTQDVDLRVKAHNEGKGAVFTAKRRPVKLVFFESHANIEDAGKRERQLKRWSRAKKTALIHADYGELRGLSKSHDQSRSSKDGHPTRPGISPGSLSHT